MQKVKDSSFPVHTPTLTVNINLWMRRGSVGTGAVSRMRSDVASFAVQSVTWFGVKPGESWLMFDGGRMLKAIVLSLVEGF